MLNLFGVYNSNIDDVREKIFDIGIFASGYESRCTHMAKNIDPVRIKRKLVLGFKEIQDDSIRKINDQFYNDIYGDITVISSKEEREIYLVMSNIFNEIDTNEEINILVDYTSMSRLWYLGILNFIRFQKNSQTNVYFNYSLGVYNDSFLDKSYSSINSLPSHEGSLSSNNKTLLVLTVGFSPYLIKSVIEEIEPNGIIGILALPNLKPEYEIKSLEIKNNILTKDIDEWTNCPVSDLESIFRTYTEITSNNINNKDIIFLSLGPKIFTLASILVSQRFEQVTCLYLKYSGSSVLDIKPTGDFICSKVVYKL